MTHAALGIVRFTRRRRLAAVATLPGRWRQQADASLEFGGVVFGLEHRGGAHTPGDMPVGLPQQRMVCSGGVFNVDRLPGVLPVRRARSWPMQPSRCRAMPAGSASKSNESESHPCRLA